MVEINIVENLWQLDSKHHSWFFFAKVDQKLCKWAKSMLVLAGRLVYVISFKCYIYSIICFIILSWLSKRCQKAYDSEFILFEDDFCSKLSNQSVIQMLIEIPMIVDWFKRSDVSRVCSRLERRLSKVAKKTNNMDFVQFSQVVFRSNSLISSIKPSIESLFYLYQFDCSTHSVFWFELQIQRFLQKLMLSNLVASESGIFSVSDSN